MHVVPRAFPAVRDVIPVVNEGDVSVVDTCPPRPRRTSARTAAGELRRLQEPGRLRQLRRDRRQEPASRLDGRAARARRDTRRAMSQENVELVREAYAACNDGGPGCDAGVLDADIELQPGRAVRIDADRGEGSGGVRSRTGSTRWRTSRSTVERLDDLDRASLRYPRRWAGEEAASRSTAVGHVGTVREGRLRVEDGTAAARRPSKPWGCRSRRCRRRTWRWCGAADERWLSGDLRPRSELFAPRLSCNAASDPADARTSSDTTASGGALTDWARPGTNGKLR